MSTTDLSVEILVIGVGAVIWLTLLILSIFGYSQPDFTYLLSVVAMIPILAIIYILGIIIDRLADRIFDFWKPALREEYYESDPEEFADRRYIYVHSEQLTTLLEYGRSRLRICRGWALNSVLMLICGNLFLLRQPLGEQTLMLLIVGNIALLLLTAGLIYAWYQLTVTDYRKVKGQSNYLRALHNSREGI